MLEHLFKSLVWDALIKAALARLFLAVPLLGWGPIGYVITWAVMKYSGELYAAIRQFIRLEEIAFRNEGHQKAYEAAALKLHLIAIQDGVDSESFRKQREIEKYLLSKFVRFDVAR